MTALTQDFNTATVKVGDNFDITLPIGGFVGKSWKDPEVVSGGAKLVQAPERKSAGCMGPFNATWTFKAETVGDIEIVAKSNIGTVSTFKVHVK